MNSLQRPSTFSNMFWQFALMLSIVAQVSGEAAILNVSYVRESDSNEGSLLTRSYVTYCAAYNPELSKLPAATEPRRWTKLQVGGMEMNLCDETAVPSVIPGAFLAAMRSNCSAYEQGVTAQRAKAAGLIITTTNMIFPGQPNRTIKEPSIFPILVLRQSYMDEIEELLFSEQWQISFYALDDGYIMDGSGLCLICIAVVVITLGSFRSGQHRFDQLQTAHNRTVNAMEPKLDDEEGKPATNESDRGGVHFGSAAVVLFAVFMTGLLVLMYFFYDYLVYLFICLFVLGSVSGCYECFKPLLLCTDVGAFRISLGNGVLNKCCGPNLDIRGMMLFLASCGLAAAWVVLRNNQFGWLLLDVLGSFLLVSVLIGIQLPNLKSCTIFLSLLFIYDVFFVFITPFFTKDGQSVMIQVATGGYDPTRDSGGGQREVIPAAFKVPHIPSGALCENLFDDNSYSLLGFGDVMVPGFLISYLRAYELVTKTRPVYSASACFAYLFSLIITTIALIFMRTGQPALLYIVPILLCTVLCTAWRRRELAALWNGDLAALYRMNYDAQPVNDSKGKDDGGDTVYTSSTQELVKGKSSAKYCRV